MKRIYLLLFLTLTFLKGFSQVYNFEDQLPSTFSVTKGEIELSRQRTKEGEQALLWKWNGENSVLSISESSVLNRANSSFNSRSGITLWIYNDLVADKPIVFRFKNSEGDIVYQFDYHLKYLGWKACWIAFQNMWSSTGGKPTMANNIATMEVVSPDGVENGQVFIDRFNITTTVDNQATPDAQIPENNRFFGREIWHWGLIWKWETLSYDLPMPDAVTDKESQDLKTMAESIKAANKGGSVGNKIVLDGMLNTLRNKGVISGGTDVKRVSSLVSTYDPQYDSTIDYNLESFADLIDKLARGWYYHNREDFKLAFMETMEWAMDQGFTVGCSMGTNHHYGYEIRKFFPAILWMKEPLREAGMLDKVAQVVGHWAGLPETRQDYDIHRDEMADSWNTMLFPRLIAVLMYPTDEEMLREMYGFLNWTSGSLCYTPGTLGGIKVDGSGFHHGGHYPAYSVPGYSTIGNVLGYLNQTDFDISAQAKEVFKHALLSVTNYSNKLDWGTGLSGRHPLNTLNRIGTGPQQAYAKLAMSYDPIDKDLAETFLRIYSPNTESTELAKQFTSQGLQASEAPSGFFPFNYSCYGVFRDKNWMVGLKGYNKWVWGSEIYRADNRYGRYQSYGSVQIIVDSEIESRWTQPGWDWNRLPGTTTVHLPFSLLNSPIAGTLMARSPTETFSGATSLDNKYGMFATKIQESTYINFTPSFVARKSVFCVGNRLVCLGSGITNTNNKYPTETTIFQQNLLSDSEGYFYNGVIETAFPLNQVDTIEAPFVMSDLTGNYYRIEPGSPLVTLRQNQESRHDKTQAVTNGKFATAYLNHGLKPSNASYEYMITVQATEEDKQNMLQKPYVVHRQDNVSHIVEDIQEGVFGYSIFEDFSSEEDQFIRSCSKETLIMLKYTSPNLQISICDPDINIGDASYTTTNPSESKTKTIVMNGSWSLFESNNQISVVQRGANTELIITCIEGTPVEFVLVNQNPSSNIEQEADSIVLVPRGASLDIYSDSAECSIFTIDGVLLSQFVKDSGLTNIPLKAGAYIVNFTLEQGRVTKKVVI